MPNRWLLLMAAETWMISTDLSEGRFLLFIPLKVFSSEPQNGLIWPRLLIRALQESFLAVQVKENERDILGGAFFLTLINYSVNHENLN